MFSSLVQRWLILLIIRSATIPLVSLLVDDFHTSYNSSSWSILLLIVIILIVFLITFPLEIRLTILVISVSPLVTLIVVILELVLLSIVVRVIIIIGLIITLLWLCNLRSIVRDYSFSDCEFAINLTLQGRFLARSLLFFGTLLTFSILLFL